MNYVVPLVLPTGAYHSTVTVARQHLPFGRRAFR